MANPTTICRDCGQSVYEHRGQLLVPVTGVYLTGQIIGAGREDLATRFVYLPHACDPGDIADYEQSTAAAMQVLMELRQAQESPWSQANYVDALAAARGTQRELRELIARHSLEHPCPRCDAEIGHPCLNLTRRRSGVNVPNVHPHAERTPDISAMPEWELFKLQRRLTDQQSLTQQIADSLSTEQQLTSLIDRLRRESRFAG